MLSVLNFVLSRKNRVRSNNAHKTTFEEEKNVGLKKRTKNVDPSTTRERHRLGHPQKSQYNSWNLSQLLIFHWYLPFLRWLGFKKCSSKWKTKQNCAGNLPSWAELSSFSSDNWSLDPVHGLMISPAIQKTSSSNKILRRFLERR